MHGSELLARVSSECPPTGRDLHSSVCHIRSVNSSRRVVKRQPGGSSWHSPVWWGSHRARFRPFSSARFLGTPSEPGRLTLVLPIARPGLSTSQANDRCSGREAFNGNGTAPDPYRPRALHTTRSAWTSRSSTGSFKCRPGPFLHFPKCEGTRHFPGLHRDSQRQVSGISGYDFEVPSTNEPGGTRERSRPA